MRSDYYRDQLKVGQAYEQYAVRMINSAEGADRVQVVHGFAQQMRYGDTNIGVEFKFDRKFHETGNLYIEVQETTAEGHWVDSGIFRADLARWYAIGDYSHLYVYTKVALRAEFVRRGRIWIEIDRHTSRGFLIKPTDVPRVTERVWPSTWDGNGR